MRKCGCGSWRTATVGRGRSARIEELDADHVVRTEVVHIDKESLHLNVLVQARAHVLQDVADVLNHHACLNRHIEYGDAHHVGPGHRKCCCPAGANWCPRRRGNRPRA